MKNNPYQVEISEEEGFIRILRKGKEMVYWDQLEWEEDSSVMFPITRAIQAALTDPEQMDRILRQMGKIK